MIENLISARPAANGGAEFDIYFYISSYVILNFFFMFLYFFFIYIFCIHFFILFIYICIFIYLNLVEINMIFEYDSNLCFCQDFVSMEKKKEGGRIFNP